MNVLIVEDDMYIANMIRKILRNIPSVHIIDYAAGFEEAFSKSVSGVFDLIIVDILLKEERFNGIELCSSIRRSDAEIPLVIVTSCTALEYLREAFEAGANDYITKPFRAKELEYRVRRLFASSSQREQHEKIRYQKLCYDEQRNEFYYQHKKLALTKKQKSLLLLFLRQPEMLLSSDYIKEKFWGDYPHIGKRRNVRSNIHLLRNSLTNCSDISISTVRGEGYLLQKRT